MEEGHQVVLHVRSRERAPAVADLALRSVGVVIGDLSSAVETRKIAEQVNGIGRMDAVIHNAGTYLEPSRGATPEGHARTLTVNTLAPYMLTALIERPGRLIYLSSSMHRGVGGSRLICLPSSSAHTELAQFIVAVSPPLWPYPNRNRPYRCPAGGNLAYGLSSALRGYELGIPRDMLLHGPGACKQSGRTRG